MWQQNERLRRYGRKPFGELLHEMLRDPAMLIWLDADSNTKRSPNENLARELMELFTLGIGNYTERDVNDAARALTGRTLRDGSCVDEVAEHDSGIKQVVGRTGHLSPDSLADVLLAQAATSKRLAWRICEHFLGEGVASAEELDVLAAGLLKRKLDVTWAVTRVIRSQRFFADATLGHRISPPVVFVTSSVLALDPMQRRPSPAVLADWMAEMGQDLFNPPNVGGWPGGRV